MKFLKSEHSAFKKIIDSSALDYRTFAFVKKQGWLSISHPIMADPFRFHRKDESRLDDQGKWIKSSSYTVNIRKETLDIESFEGVLLAFESWLMEVE